MLGAKIGCLDEYGFRRLRMRALLISIAVWFDLILVGATWGGLGSFYTGKASELPKWNGWNYFWFAAKEGAIISSILSFPIAVIAFLIIWSATRHEPATTENRSNWQGTISVVRRVAPPAILLLLSMLIWGLYELSIMPYAANKNSTLLGKGEIEAVWGMIVLLAVAWIACLRWLLMRSKIRR
jgi:hypothetical protein